MAPSTRNFPPSMKRTYGFWSGQRPVLPCVSLILAGVLGISACSRKRLSAQVQHLTQTSPAGKPAADAAADPVPPIAEWPREYAAAGGQTVLLYEPVVEQWNDFETMRVRAAVEVQEQDAAEAVYGALWMSGRTDTDTDARRVLLTGREIDDLRFPGVAEAEAGRMRQFVDAALPASEPLVFNLDRILASVDGPVQGEAGLEVGLDPPPIFYSANPAMLVIFLGEPAFDVVRDGSGLEFCVNTNWDLFRVTATGRYYVQVEDGWMETENVLLGPWRESSEAPAIFAEFPDDENWSEVRANMPGKRLAIVPQVFVSTQPAEMIVTSGPAEFEELPGSALSYVVNTDSTLFLHRDERNFYFLAAGRWFRAPALQGPWLAATFDLPEAFMSLPEGEDWADVRAAVPGTPEAQEAALLASIPRKAEVNRSEAALQVDYDGEPMFAPVEGVQNISYATNTPYDVLSVATGPGSQYYACHQGVWFESGTPHGPWVLCDAVPDPVYTIPPSSPKYNVTYVRVYDSTPTTVVTGYYPGYVGTYVVGGAILFGLGYWIGSDIYDDHHYYHRPYWRGYRYRPYWYSYGCGARYRHSHGGYLRYARYYGPYGGVGRIAVWNPHSRSYVRGYKAYGPRGGVWARGAYQPFTDTWRGRARATSPYATWGRNVVTRNERWTEAGRWDERRRSAARRRDADEGGLVRAGRTDRDGRAFALRGGDVKVGRDGQVYRQKDRGWEKWEKNKGWETASAGEGVERPDRGGRGQVAISRPSGRDSAAAPNARVRRDAERVRTRTDDPARAEEGRKPPGSESERRRTSGLREGERGGEGRTEERPRIVDGSREGPASGRRGERQNGGRAETGETTDQPRVAEGSRERGDSGRRAEADDGGRREGRVEREEGSRPGARAREETERSRAERRPGIVDGSREGDSAPRRRVAGEKAERSPGAAAEPSAGERQPSTRQSEPSARERQPSTRQSEPSARERQPSTRRSEPSARERQPSTRQSEPSARERQPSIRQSEPSAREPQPSTRQSEPSVRERQPSTRQSEPSAREREPSTRQSQPAARQSQPAARERQPSARQSQPAAPQPQPSAQQDRDRLREREREGRVKGR